MPTTSTYQIQVNFTQDLNLAQAYQATAVTNSRAVLSLISLNGDTTILSGNFTSNGNQVRGIIVVPPTDNTTGITLKGNAADTGIPLNPSDSTLISINPSSSGTIILNTSTTIQQVRIIYL